MASLSPPRPTPTPIQWWMLLGVLILIFAGTLMPGYLKDAAHDMLGRQYPWPPLAHFVLFGLLAAVPVYGGGWPGTLRLMLLALAVAAATEYLQHFVVGRHPTVRDALIDLAGASSIRMVWLLGVFHRSYGRVDCLPGLLPSHPCHAVRARRHLPARPHRAGRL